MDEPTSQQDDTQTLSSLLQRGVLSFHRRPGDGGSEGGDGSATEYASSDDDETDTDTDMEYYRRASDAQAQWEESMRQIEQLLTYVLVPVIGKFFGRRFAYFRKYFSNPDQQGRRFLLTQVLMQSGARLPVTGMERRLSFRTVRRSRPLVLQRRPSSCRHLGQPPPAVPTGGKVLFAFTINPSYIQIPCLA